MRGVSRRVTNHPHARHFRTLFLLLEKLMRVNRLPRAKAKRKQASLHQITPSDDSRLLRASLVLSRNFDGTGPDGALGETAALASALLVMAPEVFTPTKQRSTRGWAQTKYSSSRTSLTHAAFTPSTLCPASNVFIHGTLVVRMEMGSVATRYFGI